MMFFTLVSLLVALATSTEATLDIAQNHDEVTVRLGESADLTCTAKVDYKSCSFVRPDGTSFTVYAGVNYGEGIVPDVDKAAKKCGIRLSKVTEQQHGTWKCKVDAVDQGSFVEGEGVITVTVALPPQRVMLRVDGQESPEGAPLTVKLGGGERVPVMIDCVAVGSRPKPTFAWFIGDTRLNAETTESRENYDEQADKADYVSTLTYHGDTRHNGQDVRCEVEHGGYTAQQIEAGENKQQRKLDLFFKPQPRPAPLVLYKLKEGNQVEVPIKFAANPQPISGFWTLAGIEADIQVGTADVEEKVQSTHFERTEVDGEWQVSLDIKKLEAVMTRKNNKLTVTNDEGTTEYDFVLELGEKPAAEPFGPGPLVIVMVIVIIIILVVVVAVIARSKGMLCFAAKNGEQLTEEKDAGAFDAAEKGEPLNPKADSQAAAAGDAPQQAAPQAAAADKKEEEDKKSNGAHTPV